MTEQTPENVQQAAHDYSPEEIRDAMQEESVYGTQAILNQAQQRNLALNIENKRAAKKIAKLEDDNRLLRAVIKSFDTPAESEVKDKDKEAVDDVVAKYLEQSRQATKEEAKRDEGDGTSGSLVSV